VINGKEIIQPETTFSRRRLLINSVQLTAGAATLLTAGATVGAMPAKEADPPKLPEEIAGHWTTF
jgi:hypothetical protein